MVHGSEVGEPGGVSRSGSPCPDVPGSRDAAPGFGACLVDAGAKAEEAEAGTGRLSSITNLDHRESSLNHEHGSRSSPVTMSGVATDTVTETAIEPAPQRHLIGAKVVSWRHLPRKDQLIVITLARLSEPLVQTSLQSYMFYQLKWFNPGLPDSTIASQAGILHASFTAAQFLTAMLWGRVADSPLCGRKTVLLIGLGGTMLPCVGFGLSTSFWEALLFRFLGGTTNGNIGVLRTMTSETVKEKKYQSRAFLLLPMTFNIGIIIGPILGGLLADPAGTYPDRFGKINFFTHFPYAAPNILSAVFLFFAMIFVWLFLEETLDSGSMMRDRGLELGQKLRRGFSRNDTEAFYAPLASTDSSVELELSSAGEEEKSSGKPTHGGAGKHNQVWRRYTQRLPFRRIFTRNVSFTLVANFLLAFHVGTFNSLWFVFLSTPVCDPTKTAASPNAVVRDLPFIFTGGLGVQPREVGMAMAILGVIGIGLQLGLYPWLSAQLGTVRSWRFFLLFFPITYFLVPYLSLVPSYSPPPSPKDGIAVWVAMAGVLALQVVGRTFALPAQTILVNNCTPHPSVLGTVHGIGQSVSSFARTLWPMLVGFLYGLGLKMGIVGAVWWCLSAVALLGFLASLFVWEGDGHEIWIEGDNEDDI